MKVTSSRAEYEVCLIEKEHVGSLEPIVVIVRSGQSTHQDYLTAGEAVDLSAVLLEAAALCVPVEDDVFDVAAELGSS